jgi:hypothetical protein
VPDVVVAFEVTQGGGVLGGQYARTDANGVASVTSWMLGRRPGVNLATATAEGLPAVSFTATGTIGPVARVAVEGNGQTGQAAATLPQPIAVRVTDDADNPIAGARVSFATTAAGDAVTNPVATTDAAGTASAGLWTLGPGAGARRLVVTVRDTTGAQVTAEYTATARAVPVRLEVRRTVGPTATVGTALATPVTVVVRDASGAPIPGTPVRFTTAGGRLAGASTAADSAGEASVASWELPTTAGLQVLEVVAGDPRGATASASVTVDATPADLAALTLVSGSGQTDTTGAVLARPLVVRAVDRYGNGVSGVRVGFAVTGGGGTVRPAAATTDARGEASVVLTLGDSAGPNVVQAARPDDASISRVTVVATAEWPPFLASAVEIGHLHACGIRLGGGAECWGLNEHGQLGDGTLRTRGGAVARAPAGGHAAVHAGRRRRGDHLRPSRPPERRTAGGRPRSARSARGASTRRRGRSRLPCSAASSFGPSPSAACTPVACSSTRRFGAGAGGSGARSATGSCGGRGCPWRRRAACGSPRSARAICTPAAWR